jgi:hypothetical protein
MPAADVLKVARWKAARDEFGPYRRWFRSIRALRWGAARFCRDSLARLLRHLRLTTCNTALDGCTHLDMFRWLAARMEPPVERWIDQLLECPCAAGLARLRAE